MFTTCMYSASDMSGSGQNRRIPALLTRTSMWPRFVSASSTTAAQSSSFETSKVPVVRRLAERLGQFLADIVEHIADDDPRALLDEAAGRGGALAAGGAGDDRDAIGQFRHGGTTTYLGRGRIRARGGRPGRW